MKVIVVRIDLKMKPGKVAAQVGHGVLAAYKESVQKAPYLVDQWEEIGQMKVVLQCQSEKELLDIHANARKMGLISEYICDAGRTQVDPGSKTVVAIGPAESGTIDQVTGHLKLYN
jgi:PTH2 family peptidyl-tRNA hydrolase